MLKGPRVVVRALTKADMPSLLNWGLDVEVELLGGGDPPHPSTIEAWEKWFADHLGKDTKDTVNFGIEANEKLIGTCGLWRFNMHSQTCDLGISIGDREYWGRGFAGKRSA